MNSEELELSLRTEFESYLSGVLNGLRQDVSEFQKNFEAEFEKHKSQTDEAFRNLFKRFESNPQFDQSFTESVVEHLRLARDDGATITAAAIGEAEKLSQESAPTPEFDKLRDAIKEISSKTSQSEILKSLVEAAANFTPRGAFFIVKNDHFVGWRAFGKEGFADEATVRSIQFPTSADCVLTDAVMSLSTMTAAHGGHADDGLFLEPLEYGRPDRMYAIPLTARGRGVAVLYADYGSEGVKLNAEALETLVRVAGLTVELAASAQPSSVQPTVTEQVSVSEPTPSVAENFSDTYTDETEISNGTSVPEIVDDEVRAEEFQAVSEIESVDEGSVQDEPEIEAVEEYTGVVSVEEPEFGEAAVITDDEQISDIGSIDNETPEVDAAEVEEITYFEPIDEFEVSEPEVTESKVVEPEVIAPAFSETNRDEGSIFNNPFEAVAEEPERVLGKEVPDDFVSQPEISNGASNGTGKHAPTEPLAEVAVAQTARTSYRDRNVDLPIEVADDERRLHNDARRFARLLVSEIKLYNEQKVTDGRESGDLYDRLREAIDRSRDMYDKRVQEPVAERFDYFHYELVNSLADGEDVKLGASYPGSKVPA